MPAKKAKPTKQATSAKPRKANRAIETVADVVEEYQEAVSAAADTVLSELQIEHDGNPQMQVATYRQAVDRTTLDDDAEYGKQQRDDYPKLQAVSDEAGLPYTTKSGLLARFPDGTLREPTPDELFAMGRVLAAMLFPRQSDAAESTEANPNDPPKPKISGNHCRLCASFAGNDQRGPLWSESGHCLTYKHVQNPVQPEHYCERFVFNEGLRG